MNPLIKIACLISIAATALAAAAYTPKDNSISSDDIQTWELDFILEQISIIGHRSLESNSDWVVVCRKDACETYVNKLAEQFQPSTTLDSLDTYGLEKTEIAKLTKQQDVRCQGGSTYSKTTSLADGDTRLAATQTSFDNASQRNQIASGLFQIVVFGIRTLIGDGHTYSFTMTFADGGTEDYLVKSLTNSLNIEPIKGTLKQSDGQVREKSCGTT